MNCITVVNGSNGSRPFCCCCARSGAALGGFLVLAALVIVANTIKLTLYARQDELEAMTMVGATALFIKLPYLIEGALQGLFGGLLALLVSLPPFACSCGRAWAVCCC